MHTYLQFCHKVNIFSCAVLESFGDESEMDYRKEKFDSADEDMDGWINYDEFLNLIYNFNSNPGAPGLSGLAQLCYEISENIKFVGNLSVGEQLEYGLF